jgi:hypothetical protein
MRSRARLLTAVSRIERGILDPSTRDDTNAIRKALYRFFATALARRM